MKHTLTRIPGKGYHCTTCLWNWQSRPSTYCPGVPRYEWGKAPAHLKTESQLHKLHYKLPDDARPAGFVQLSPSSSKAAHYLYDQAAALPYTHEELAAQRERRRAARYRTCSRCGTQVPRKKYDAEWEACAACLPAVIDAHRLAEQQRQETIARRIAADRDSAICWARALLAHPQNVYILDTETTGLSGDSEIVQVAVIDLAGHTIYDSLVKPILPIPAESIGIHGITNQMVATAPRFDVVHARLMDLLRGKTVVIYNADFDTRMIYHSGKPFGYLPSILADDWQCAMERYAAFCGQWSERHGAYRWQPLPGGDHTALGDCRATLAIIQRMAAASLSTEQTESEVQVQ